MSQETIDIVVRESGAAPAAQSIANMGKAASVSDTQIGEMLTRTGLASSNLTSLTSTTGTAIRSLSDLGIGATRVGSALGVAGANATAAAREIGAVAETSGVSAASLRAMSASGTAAAASLGVVGTEAGLTGGKFAAMAASSTAAEKGMLNVGKAANVAKVELGAAGIAANGVKDQFNALQATLIGLGVAFGVKQLIGLSDTYTSMQNKLLTLGGGQEEFIAKQTKVFEVAQNSRQALESVNAVYVGLAKSSANLNLSATNVVRVTDILAKSATIAGKDLDDAGGALKRFGLSLLKGSVDGRGFMQFLLQFPGLSVKVAEALGFVGKNGFARFMEAAQNGAISAQEFVNKIVQIGPKIDAQFKRMDVTVSQAFTQLSNAILRFVGESDQATGASAKLASMIQGIIPYVPQLVQATLILTAALSAYAVAATIAKIATLAFSGSFAGIIAIVAGLAAAVYFFGDSIKLTSDGSVTLLGALVGAFRFVRDILVDVVKWMTTTSEGAGVLGVAVGILTGLLVRMVATAVTPFVVALVGMLPTIGLVVLALGGLVAALAAMRYAWVLATQGFKAANQDFVDMKNKVVDLASSVKDKLGTSVTDATKEMQGGFLGAGSAAKDFSDKVDEAGISVVKFGQGGSAAVKKLTDEVNGGAVTVVSGSGRMSRGIQEIGDTATTAGGQVQQSTAKMGQSFGDLRSQFQSDSSGIRNAFGDMLKSTDDWANRSGALFNKVAGDAMNASNAATAAMSKIQSVASVHSQGTGATGSTGWGSPTGENLQGDWFGAYNTANNGANSGISDLSQWYGATGGYGGIADIGWGYATGGSFEVGGSGGTDSQMVKFMATPGERVTVETPGQQAAGNGGRRSGGSSDRAIDVKMYITTPDANSFRNSQSQITLKLANELRRTTAQLGGP